MSSLWPYCLKNPNILALIQQLRSVLRGCQTVLDVGCGNGSPMRYVAGPHLVGVDGYPPAIEEARAAKTHDEFIVGDVKQISKQFPGRRFDACVALDVIEHLQKEDGWRMLEAMEALATKRVVIFTPNGFVPQHSQNGDLQEHLSGWTAEELRPRGYQVFGMCGPKSFRGEYHQIKYQPRAGWALASVFIDYLHTRSHPESGAAIFCVKKIG